MGKRVVVVGAGYAGLMATKKLAKKVKKHDVDITIIDRNPFSTMLTELHEVAASRVDESSIRMDLKKIFAGRKVNVKLDTVETIDFENKVVKGAHESYEYDYVVLGAGSKPTYFGIEGAKEHTHTLWSYDDAVALRDHINATFTKAAQTSDPNHRRHLLTFYVVGAGFTGVEMMGELAEYAPILCDKLGLSMDEVTMVEVDAMPRAVMNLPEKLAGKIQRRLEKMGVELKLNAKVVQVTDHSIKLDVNGVVEENNVHTVIWTAGIESADVTTESGKALNAAQRAGRVETDEFLRAKGHENVYVVGDNAWFVPEGEERAVPQMVENAEQSGALVAHNITQEIRGSKNLKAYKPAFHGTMVCIGGRWGTANIKLGKLEFNLVSFFAMFAKHMMNCVYFVQVLGWNKVFSYLKNEIFTIRNRRSFVGGHFSNRTPSFLLFPLRVWLGFTWLMEGILKVNEGWLKGDPKLKEFFGYSTQFFNGLLKGDGTAGATGAVSDVVSKATGAAATVADAASSATGGGAAAGAGQMIWHWDVFGVFHPMLASATGDFFHTKFTDLAFKFDFSLMNWFVDNVLTANSEIQVVMQWVVVVMEILLGLALIVGLLTTLTATISLSMQVMFVMTTGLYFNSMWMTVASIALIFGGNTLSLDYYFMPWLKKVWKKIPFAKKWYIYHD